MEDKGRVEGLGQLWGHFCGEVGLTWMENTHWNHAKAHANRAAVA
jgi:hypothetical protein